MRLAARRQPLNPNPNVNPNLNPGTLTRHRQTGAEHSGDDPRRGFAQTQPLARASFKSVSEWDLGREVHARNFMLGSHA